jgi:hypothetical protein
LHDRPTFHDPEEKLLSEIQHLVDAAVQGVCEDHYDAPTQEPPTTARIAQAIEIAIKRHPINVDGLTVEVATQDVPSQGSKMQKRIGGDLYISLVRRDKEIPVSKGLLVQVKWDRKLASDPYCADKQFECGAEHASLISGRLGRTASHQFPRVRRSEYRREKPLALES